MRERQIFRYTGLVSFLLSAGRIVLSWIGASTVIEDARAFDENLANAVSLIAAFPLEWAYVIAIISFLMLIAVPLLNALDGLGRSAKRMVRSFGRVERPYISPHDVRRFGEALMGALEVSEFSWPDYERLDRQAARVLHQHAPLMHRMALAGLPIHLPDRRSAEIAICVVWQLGNVQPWLDAGDVANARTLAGEAAAYWEKNPEEVMSIELFLQKRRADAL